MKQLIFTLLAISAMCSGYAQVSFGEAEKFNDGWHFILEDVKDGAREHMDYKSWQELNLPHDWSVEHNMSPSLYSCTGYLPGGVAWYRKEFKVEKPSKRHYIYFEGVYNRCEVYLNGELLGYRPNGYMSFMYDLTPHLNSDGNNILAVRVDHSREADSRWYTGSGIYRDVWIVKAGETHLSQWGVGYRATKFEKNLIEVEVDFSVESHGVENSRLEVVNELFDAQGKSAAKSKQRVGKLNSSKESHTVKLRVADAKRWSLKNPYLYSLKTTLYSNGKIIDQTTTSVGLRELEFCPNRGFALNGEWTKVKGVCLHHDAGVLGAVVPEDVWRRRLENLKSIGVNAIRMSHNPHAPAVYHLCDELGLLVMDEASDEWEFPKRKWLKGWNKGTPGFDGSYDFFLEWGERDLIDMVRRDRNHPSIFLWSIGNEVDYPNDPYSHPVLDGGGESGFTQPAFGGYQPDAPDAMRIGVIAEQMVKAVRSIDTSRPTTGALAGVVMSNETAYPQAVDIVGYNYTESRYISDHKRYPNRIIYGSENRSDYKAWTYVRDMEHIFGQFIWTGTDYLGESGRWPSRGLGTGLLDFASYTKGRGYFRASLWCDEPVAYIGTYRTNERVSIDAIDLWNYRDGELIRVVAYTNASSARLLLDGEVVGEPKPYDMQSGVILWDIPFKEGELKVEGLNADGTVESTYSIATSGRPYSLRATVYKSTLEGCSRVAHITVEVLDDEGNVVKLADNLISCRVKGAGHLLGLENGSNSETSHAKDSQRRVHRGRLLAYVESTHNEGQIEIEFSSPLLESAQVVINVTDIIE